jgi:hypothetical protein
MEGVFIWVVIVVGIINIFQNILKIIFQNILKIIFQKINISKQ